ncbi:MAG: hypothetical protein II289_07155 [Bacteroidales bacterium]|nr:hypothetical protein [Bacteroidales bacterium]
MATSREYALFVENLFRGVDGFSMKRMFGEYGIYLQGRVLGFLCDEQILLQDTPTARKLLPDAERKELFPGSKLFIIFSDEGNHHLLQSVALAMWEELPVPKPRKGRKGAGTSPDVKETQKIVRRGDLTSDDEEINDFLHFHRKDRK